MGMYAAIGILQALFTFGMGASISLLTYFASANLHAKSISKIFFAPSSWFSSVPTGRILSVFGKDCDVLDSLLADSLRMSLMIFGNVISSVALVSVYFPYFLIAIFVVFWGYLYFWQYYRASSREIKRLDSILRSLLYGHFTETLSGLATIRAYGETERFRRENASYIDLENRVSRSNRRKTYLLTSIPGVLSY
jgi:ABC-type multidrug transport system fused ATPase/permease subunit